MDVLVRGPSSAINKIVHAPVYKYALKREDRKNGIVTHAWDEDHWEEARVITVEPSYWKRRVQEALRIQSVGSMSNLDCGLTLDPVWLQFLDQVQEP